MDYKQHYDRLINRAKTRVLLGYFEKHHIVPRCIGGNDTPQNLVCLTPEEHYVAHQLLVKLYPDVDALVYAARKMTVASKNVKRRNKLYGWLKRKYHVICKKRIGHSNPSFGKPWYHNTTTGVAKKFKEGLHPEGWIKGRTPKTETLCEVCQQPTGKTMARFCTPHRKENVYTYAYKGGESHKKRKTEEDFEKFTDAITTSKTWIEAIKKAGFKTDGYSRTRLQKFAKDNNLSLMDE